jgi:hypothetical protein
VLVWSVLLYSLSAEALVPAMSYDYYATGELINPQTQEIDLSTLSMLAKVSDPFRFSMSDYIPLKGLADSDSGDRVARRILQKSMQNLIDGYKNQHQGVIASAQRVSNNLNTSVGSGNQSVQVRLRPFEARAEMIYRGTLPVDSSISYAVDQNELRFEVSRKISETTVAYSHISLSDQQKDLVGLRWNF